jgi:hypothetical protein
MQLQYNVTGERRKALVSAISRKLGASIKYLAAPTFAYEVGGYHIDKNGTLTGADNRELVSDLMAQGFQADSVVYADDFAWAERELRRLALEDENVPDRSNRGQYGGDEFDRMAVEMPKADFTDAAIANLKRLIDSKASLIKKALGANDLPLIESGDRIGFPWFDSADPKAVKAYTHFIAALCYTAKNQRRITATDKPVENEKYAFRCFLLRLGFIGAEFKTERKILLDRLTGDAAFKNGTRSAEAEVAL